MRAAQEIQFGKSKTCVLMLEQGSVYPARDPELTVSRYPVHDLARGELFIEVTRSSMPAIVKVEAAEHDTGLNRDEVEQIRKTAEAIFRSKFG